MQPEPNKQANKTTMDTTETTAENSQPTEPPPESDLSPSTVTLATRCRTGKIARLPFELREQLNQRLLDGEPGKTLIAWLNSLPEVQAILATQFNGYAIREQNLSEWRKGGYLAWLQEKQTRQDLTAFVEKSAGLQKSAKDGLTEPLAFYLAARAALELQRLESVPDSEEKAKAIKALTATVVSLRRGDLERERLRLQAERYGLQKKTEKERKEEFWKWADENINRDEFCRRRCFTAEQRRAAINKILGISPIERRETAPENGAAAPAAEVCSCGCCSASVPSGLAPASPQPNPA